MLNVNELTSQMAKMSDAQLRQYAQLHKTDPYTLALAASESRRRAQLRAAGQQQGAQGQQPTVADQALAQMGAPAPMPQQAQQRPQLPEQQGIGMLPAQNVEGMADGGIAGYDDSYAGGGMVAFAGEGPSLVGTGALTPEDQLRQIKERERQEALAKAAQEKTVAGFVTGFESLDANARQGLATTVRQKLQNNIPLNSTEENLVKNVPQFKNLLAEEMAKRPPPVNTATTNVAPKPKPGGPYADTQAGRDAAARRPGTGAGTGAGKDKQPPPATDVGSGFVPTKPGDLSETLQQLQFLSPGVGEYDVLANKAATGFADLEKQREATRPKEKAFTGLEALLGKEEEKAKGKEARNFNMAIVNAGLAIAGGKSQYALQNIAQGAQVGTKQYQEGLEKLEAAAIERRKQAALIEEARRAEDRGDWKESQQLKQKAFETDLGIKQTQIAAVRDIWGINQKAATELVAAQSRTAAEDARALMQQQEENKRHEAEMRNRLATTGMYTAARGQNPQNIASDNATQQLRLWQATPEGRMATPADLEAAHRRFYDAEAKRLGIPSTGPVGDPYANWGPLQVTPPKK